MPLSQIDSSTGDIWEGVVEYLSSSANNVNMSGNLVCAGTASVAGVTTLSNTNFVNGSTVDFVGTTANNITTTSNIAMTNTGNSHSITFLAASGGTAQINNNIGNISVLGGASVKTCTIGNSIQKLTVGNSLGAVLTASNLTIPNGNTATTGGIVIKGNTVDSGIYTTASANTLNVSAGTGAAIQLCQNSVSKWALSTDGLTVYTPQNLNFSTNTADKVITFTNSGGNSTITSTNSNGNMNINIPTGATYSITQNGVSKYSVSSDGLTATKGVRNLTFSDNTGDKVLTFTNSGGNSTITIANTSGNMTNNIPTGGQYNHNINGSTILAIKDGAAGTKGITVTGCLNLPKDNGNGLQIATNTGGSNVFQIVNASGTDDIYLSNGQPGNMIYQVQSTNNHSFMANGSTQCYVNATGLNTTGGLYVNGGLFTPYQALTGGSYQISNLYGGTFYLVDAITSSVTIVLPSSALSGAKFIFFLATKASTYGITLDCTTNGTKINGSTSNVSSTTLNTYFNLIYSGRTATGWILMN